MWLRTCLHFSRRRRRFLGLAAGAPLLFACGRVASAPLSVAAHLWPGYELMYLARQLGWLPPERVTLIETASASASLDELRAGRVEAVALTLDEVLRARAEGWPLTVALVFDISVGADAVLARPGLTSLAALAGQRIGVEMSALGALMLHKLLETAQLKASDVQVVPIEADGHEAAIQSGQLDAIITYEPVVSRLETAGWGRLFDSRAIPDTIFDVLAVRRDTLADRAEALRALIAGHFRALRHLQTNPHDAAYRMASRFDLSAERAYDAFRGLHLPGLEVNRRLLAPHGALLAAAIGLSSLMVRGGLLPREDDMQALASAEWLPKEVG